MKTLLLFIVVFLVSSFVSNPKETVSISQTTDFSSLNAVLVVGHFEDYEGDKSSTIEQVDLIATYLKSKGVKIKKFYNQASDWVKIKEAAKTANFFIYAGHGSTAGPKGNAGGLCLVNGIIPSSDVIAGMKLRKNAVVIFKSVCNGAGSSAMDNGDIGIKEAVNRVSYYAEPFFKIGAGCYYANNYDDQCVGFLKALFGGKNGKTSFINGGLEPDYTKPYRFDNTKEISIRSSEGGGKGMQTSYENGVATTTEYITSKSYDKAFVAKPTFSIKDVLAWK
jgi:hypothetical protein